MITKLMDCRYTGIKDAVEGFKMAKTFLIGHNGTGFYQVGMSDDMGLYYFVTKIASLLGSSADMSADILFIGMILLAAAVSIVGICLNFKNLLSRLYAITGILFLSLLSLRIGDVYTAFTFCSLTVIPLFMYFIKRKFSVSFVLFMFAGGTIISISNHIRSYAGIGVLLFILILMAFHSKLLLKYKATVVIALFSGIIAVNAFFNHLVDQRNAFFVNNNIQFENYIEAECYYDAEMLEQYQFLKRDVYLNPKIEIREAIYQAASMLLLLNHNVQR
jgi:hypothetical protein